jgi:hypothetical protein
VCSSDLETKVALHDLLSGELIASITVALFEKGQIPKKLVDRCLSPAVNHDTLLPLTPPRFSYRVGAYNTPGCPRTRPYYLTTPTALDILGGETLKFVAYADPTSSFLANARYLYDAFVKAGLEHSAEWRDESQNALIHLNVTQLPC